MAANDQNGHDSDQQGAQAEFAKVQTSLLLHAILLINRLRPGVQRAAKRGADSDGT